MTSEAPQDVAALPQTEAGNRVIALGIPVVPTHELAESWVRDVLSPEVIRIEREAAAGLLDQNDRLRSALREIVDAEDRLNAAWQDTSRGFFVEQVEDHDHARRNAIAAARDLLSQRGSGAEEAARNE